MRTVEQIVQDSHELPSEAFNHAFVQFTDDHCFVLQGEGERPWFDALYELLKRERRMPVAEELQVEMLNEWRSIVTVEHCAAFLQRLEDVEGGD